MEKVYGSLKELLHEKIFWIREDDVNYYVCLESNPGQYYNNITWVVNKNTDNVTFMGFTDFIREGLFEKTTLVDPETLKRAS